MAKDNDKNKKKKKKPLLYPPVVFMIIISAVFTTALATLNAVTIERVETQEAVKKTNAVFYTFLIKRFQKD